MDVDELDELVDFEEDAMMTDAVEDANGEIDMDPVDAPNLDGDEEMSEAAEQDPEGVTIAMTPAPFGIPDGMQEEVTMSAVEIAPIVTEWPPAPTSIPAVPSRLPEASLVPSLLQHDEGKILRSEVNSIAAEPPASPSKTLLSVNALASRPPSPPLNTGTPGKEPLSADKALAEAVPDVVDTLVNEIGEKPTEAALVAPADRIETITGESGISQDSVQRETAKIISVDETLLEGSPSKGVETAPTVDMSASNILRKDPAESDDRALANGHKDSDGVTGNEFKREQLESVHHEQEHHAADYGENTPEHDYPPIVIEIVPGVVRPLFFPLEKELWPEIERSDVSGNEEKSDPERPLLPGLDAELFKAPLRDLFVALRAVLGEDWDESRGTEMILHEKALGLKLGEDNKYTEILTLHDLVDLYTRCNCSEPMCLYVEYETVRFIAKYNAIKDVLDHNAAPPDVDSSADGEGEDQEAEHDESHEHDGQNGAAGFEEHIGEHDEADEQEDGDYEEHDEDEIEGASNEKEEGEDHDEDDGTAVQAEHEASPHAGDVLQPQDTTVDHASQVEESASESVPVQVTPVEAEHVILPDAEIVYDEHDELDEEDDDDKASDADGDTFGIDAAVRDTELKADLAAGTNPLGDMPAAAESGPSETETRSSSPDSNKLKRGPQDEEELDSERSAKRVFSTDDLEG